MLSNVCSKELLNLRSVKDVTLGFPTQQDTAREKAALSTLAADVPDIPAGPTPSLPPGADSDPAHTDWAQLACLVCKRKFQSKEVLVKHQQFSDLHKVRIQSLCIILLSHCPLYYVLS